MDWGIKLNPLIAGAAAVFGILSGFVPEWTLWHWACIIIAIVCAIAYAVFSYKSPQHHESKDALRREAAEAKTELDEIAGKMDYLFRGLLVDLWKQMEFESDHQARISIYVHYKDADGGEGRFVCCGRYSHNPILEQPGRTSYPGQQGYIKEGWENGWHYDDQFPKDEEECRQYHQEKYGIPPEALRNFKLLARFAVVQRLDDNESNPQAVLVIEGRAKPARLEETRVKNQLKELAPSYAHMVKVLWKHIPLPEDAKEKDL